jgi:molecular chaperone DnaK
MADSAIYSAQKFINENGDNIPEAQKAAVQSQITAVQSALEGGDAAAIQAAATQLQTVMQQAGAAMYQQGQTPGGAPGGNGADGSDEDVIEGEFSDA